MVRDIQYSWASEGVDVFTTEIDVRSIRSSSIRAILYEASKRRPGSEEHRSGFRWFLRAETTDAEQKFGGKAEALAPRKKADTCWVSGERLPHYSEFAFAPDGLTAYAYPGGGGEPWQELG